MVSKDLSQLSVDGVMCISLNEREDRRNLLATQFAEAGIKIEFMLVDPDPHNPERGCFESHIKCACLALERGYRNTLVLEDDATLVAFPCARIQQINRFIASDNPELFFLGATLGKVWLTWHRGIARYRAKGTFAYILSEGGCRKLIGHAPYSGTAIDKVLSKTFKAYGVFPMICQHQPECLAKSDILQFRSAGDTGAEADFWQSNWRRQYHQVVRNLGKTILCRDL
ncbi:hypothetical protein E6B08_13395 [Pseudomonas putida]|uniref:Glycosyltransferase n=1 Tax=Pseudomonas putida TaxID=303 RepID=A0A4D6X8N8_PSEPU|nr:hypothetical protein [Pseudomonas putida]QCI12294.1 hypothetical protein E6B08_13395 [Pseudomonas putida]